MDDGERLEESADFPHPARKRVGQKCVVSTYVFLKKSKKNKKILFVFLERLILKIVYSFSFVRCAFARLNVEPILDLIATLSEYICVLIVENTLPINQHTFAYNLINVEDILTVSEIWILTSLLNLIAVLEAQ